MHTIRLSSPSDLAGFVAHSLGFEPAEHVAVIFCEGVRLGALMTLPIPDVPAGQGEEVVGEVAAELRRGACLAADRLTGSVIVVVYSGSYDLAARLGEASAGALEVAGRQVEDVVIVSNGQVHTDHDTSRRDPLDPAASAVLTDAYGAVQASRRDVIGQYRPAERDPLTGIDAESVEAAWAALLDLGGDVDGVDEGEGADEVDGVDLAVAGAALGDVAVRDALVQFLLGQPQQPHRLPWAQEGHRPWLVDSRALRILLGRLRAVCRATPLGQAADILAVTAIMDGYSGNNARTRIAADIAQGIDPGHRLSALVLAACNLGANFRQMYTQQPAPAPA